MEWDILFTGLALVIGMGSLFMGWRTSRNLGKVSATINGVSATMTTVSTTLERLANHNTEITRNLREVSVRLDGLGEITETTRVTVNLESGGWEVYLRRVRARAVDSEPQYLEPRERERLLTQEGRRLLDSELIDEIEKIAKESPKLPINEFLLKLDIRFLYNKSREKNISLDIMVAVLASYIHEVQKGTVQ